MVGSLVATHVRVLHHALSAWGIVLTALAVAVTIVVIGLVARRFMGRSRTSA